MSRRDRRTRLFLASNERRRYSREREMEIYASACFPLPCVLTSRPLFAQEFYTVVECAEYSNGISTWKMAHNGDNWLPLHVTRRDARRRKPRRREETRGRESVSSSDGVSFVPTLIKNFLLLVLILYVRLWNKIVSSTIHFVPSSFVSKRLHLRLHLRI